MNLLLFLIFSLTIVEEISCHKMISNAIESLKDLANSFSKMEERVKKLEKKYKQKLKENEERVNATIEREVKRIISEKRIINVTLPAIPVSCQDVMDRGHDKDGVYTVHPKLAPKPFVVFCDFNMKGGGWTYILNRFSGLLSFRENWNAYKVGFGSLTGELWLGLDKINYFTGFEPNELLIQLTDWNSEQKYVHYRTFSVGDASQNYTLQALNGFEGKLSNDFQLSEGMAFSTFDKDNDATYKNCADYHSGGWWYYSCGNTVLTGHYYTTVPLKKVNLGKGIFWHSFHDDLYSLKEVKMMIRPQKSN